MLTITDYLNEDLIIFLEENSKERAILTLVEHLDRKCCLQNKEQFYQAVIEREHLVSTGIGMGVAIPHAKLPGYDDFFIAVGVQPRGLDWHALDGIPVRLVFLIGGPDDKQMEYLQLLSKLTLAFKDEEKRKNLHKISAASDVLSLFEPLVPVSAA